MAANEPGQPRVTADLRAPDDELTFNLTPPTSALAIAAHPDDVEFGAGATLARWAAAGCVVHYLVCTDGSKGTWDAAADTAALVATRQREQREAARRIGATGEIVFLDHVDGELASGLEERREIARWIRTLRPEIVLGHDPWKRYRIHPDHRHAGLLACEGIVAARDPHFFRELDLAPHRPRMLLLWEADRVTHVEDASAGVVRKLHALEAHTSQFRSTMHAADESELSAFRERITGRLAAHGAQYGFGAAEVFARIDDL